MTTFVNKFVRICNFFAANIQNENVRGLAKNITNIICYKIGRPCLVLSCLDLPSREPKKITNIKFQCKTYISSNMLIKSH